MGSSPFARRYSGNRSFFLFLRVLRCFSSPRWPPSRGARHPGARVAPFGHPRINSLLPIPGEFRRSTRPSSPPEAKASAVCPSLVCLLPRAGRVAPPGALGLVNLDPALDCAGAISLCFSVLSRLVNELPVRGTGRPYISGDGERAGNRRPRLFQKGGVPAAPSGTATLLRLSPSHRVRPRPRLTATDFRRPQLPWLDGRCVQGPGTYSPRHG